MDQFLEVKTGDEFEDLTANHDTKIEQDTNFVDLPNHAMTHPVIFRSLSRGWRNASKRGWTQNC
jgi:hypothetical protein